MLARLSRETKQHHHVADNDRMALLGASAQPALYASFLTRIYGFEAPVEAALLLTNGLEHWVDMRDRTHLRLLRADLCSLGVTDPGSVERCSTVFPFRHPAEALGWMYVVERNVLLHGVIERHLRVRMPDVLKAAGSYLVGQQRSNGLRLRDLGTAMDRIAKDAAGGERIVASAKAAFRMQHAWYDIVVPQRTRVA
jgi:heme oxygenase